MAQHIITHWAALDPELLVRQIKTYVDTAGLSAGASSPPEGDVTLNGDLTVAGDLKVTGNLTVDGQSVLMLNLPMSDPHIAGAIYVGKQNALTVSAG